MEEQSRQHKDGMSASTAASSYMHVPSMTAFSNSQNSLFYTFKKASEQAFIHGIEWQKDFSRAYNDKLELRVTKFREALCKITSTPEKEHLIYHIAKDALSEDDKLRE